MELLIIRHGATPGNERHVYVGKTDEGLSARGREQARAARGRIGGAVCEGLPLVYVSPMLRARQTAELLFPRAEQVLVDDLREMDFGAFEGRSAEQMSDSQVGDPRYQAWVDGLCLGACPGGESRDQLSARTRAAVRQVVEDAVRRGLDQAVIVAHGGTVMAAMDGFAAPVGMPVDATVGVLTAAPGAVKDPLSFYRWGVGCCDGYRAQVCLRDDGRLELLDPVRL